MFVSVVTTCAASKVKSPNTQHANQMSGQEIERKFLVEKGGAYREAAFSSSHIVQGYIPCEGATVRIRKRDDRAYLTIKGRSMNGGLSRYEFETEIPPQEFYGNNEGLLLAEVELGSEDEAFEKPHFIGSEVTGDRRFYNSNLLTNPFCLWRNTLPEAYR